jgi:hypothetical protein
MGLFLQGAGHDPDHGQVTDPHPDFSMVVHTAHEESTMGENASQSINVKQPWEIGIGREHAEFHNAYQAENIKNDIRFLKAIYGDRISLAPEDVTADFLSQLKSLGKNLYFFILGLTDHVTPSSYIKHKFNFLQNNVPNADPHLFYLAWNGLLRNDSFKRLLHQ